MTRRVLALVVISILIILCQAEKSDDQRNSNPQWMKPSVQPDETDGTKVVIFFHRHGDRSPSYIPESYTTQWPEGSGQLTSIGVHQLWELGNRLRSIYSQLPLNYSSGILFSRSSDFDRTLQSAESLLVGLFPPLETMNADEERQDEYPLPYGFQPVPIHTIRAETDFLLLSYDNCGQYREYLDKIVYTSEEFLNKEQESEALLQTLSEAFGETVTLKSISKYADFLFCEKAHGMEPAFGLNSSIVDEAIELNNWKFSLMFRPSEYSYLIAGELLYQIYSDLTDYMNGDSQMLLRHYSGHDSSLCALLSGLGEDIEGIPPYASFLSFVLTKIQGNYYVEYYWNSVERSSLKFCKDYEVDGRCPLDHFLKFMQVNGLQNTQSVCERDSSAFETNRRVFLFFLITVSLAIGGIVFVGIIAVQVVLAYYKKKRHEHHPLESQYSNAIETIPIDEDSDDNDFTSP